MFLLHCKLNEEGLKIYNRHTISIKNSARSMSIQFYNNNINNRIIVIWMNLELYMFLLIVVIMKEAN